MRAAQFIPVPYSDWFPSIKEKTYYLWNESWRTEGRELRTLKVRPGKWKSATMKLNRSEEVVINRLRLGHTHMTHGYLMDDNSLGQRPVCEWCGAALLTVHHIIVECQGLQRERSRMMATTKQREWNMKNLLSDGGKIHVVLEFLRMTNIFDHI